MENDIQMIHQFKTKKTHCSDLFEPHMDGCAIKSRGDVAWVEIYSGGQLSWAVLEKGEIKKLIDKWRQK